MNDRISEQAVPQEQVEDCEIPAILRREGEKPEARKEEPEATPVM